ncbi:MAG: peptidase S1, partial [Ralstonia sp.]
MTSDFAGHPKTLGAALAAAALSAVLLAGCGGDDSPTASSGGLAANAGAATTQPVTAADQPLVDNTIYGTGPNDALPPNNIDETAAVTHHKVT